MMPTIEETLTPDIEAQLEFEEWQRIREADEVAREHCEHMRNRESWWEHMGNVHNNGDPLLTCGEWRHHSNDYSAYLDMAWKD